MNTWNRVLFCTTAIGILGAGCAAAAATPAAGDAQGTPAANSVQEVVVTAERRTEALENVPASVTVVTPETLKAASINNFMQLSAVAVGTQMTYAGSVPGVAIRGVTSTISGFSIDSNVAVYVDDLYNPQEITLASDMANIAGVQVLKGPQGTLYGRDATGGAIIITTLGPSKVWTGSFDAAYGSFNERTFNGYIAGPITDRIRFSLTGHYDAGDSNTRQVIPPAINTPVGPATKYAYDEVRGKLQVDVTDNLQANLVLNADYQNDPRTAMYSTFAHSPFAGIVPPIAANKYGFEYNEGDNPNGAHVYQAGLKLVYKTPIGDLTSFTGYGYRRLFNYTNFDSTILNLLQFRVNYIQKTFQQSVYYNINAIKNLDLLVGGEYYTDDFRTKEPFGFIYISSGSIIEDLHQKQWTDSWAVYMDGTYHLTSQWSLEAGVRYSSDHIQTSWNDFFYPAPPPAAPITIYPLTSFQHSWSAVTPQASIRYELAPRTNVYFKFSEGYRPGAFNPSGPSPGLPFAPVQNERITSYELGVKTAQPRFRFKSAFFYYDYTNLQVSLIEPVNVGGTTVTAGILSNAPKATIYGWDNELDVSITDRLNGHASFEWLHGRYGSFPNGSGTGVDPSTNLNNSGSQNWTGLQMVRAPNYSGNVGLDYTQPLPYGSLFFTTNLYFTGSFPIDDPSVYGPTTVGGVVVPAPAGLNGKQRFMQPSYVLLSAQLTWNDPSKHWNVSVYGNNLTNAGYRLSYHASPLIGDWSIPAYPITCGVRLGYKF